MGYNVSEDTDDTEVCFRKGMLTFGYNLDRLRVRDFHPKRLSGTWRCMKLRHLIQFIVILASLLLTIGNASAQMSSEFWITAKSDYNGLWDCPLWRLWFGNHVNATYGIDSLNLSLVEKTLSPPGETFFSYWSYIPGRPRPALEVLDFRGIPSNFNQLDTFRLFFSDPNFSNSDITIKWPEADYLAQRCDSMFLVESTEQILPIDAFTTDSIVIVDAGDRNITRLFIYKYGCKIIDDVDEGLENIPVVSALNQNYPNPFNPQTQITFSVPKATDVTLKVYDVLGREIAILVNERKQPGEYHVTWNAEGVPSGVYFYRIVAGEFVETKKMVVVK